MQDDKLSWGAAYMIEGAEMPCLDRGDIPTTHPAKGNWKGSHSHLWLFWFSPLVMSLPALEVEVCAKALLAQMLHLFVHDLN